MLQTLVMLTDITDKDKNTKEHKKNTRKLNMLSRNVQIIHGSADKANGTGSRET